MKNKPIEYFQTDKEFQKCAKEWQHKLFLDDWFIKFELVDQEIYAETDNSSSEAKLFGYCQKIWENHEALIRISHIKNLDGAVTRGIEELTLIHELLHCKLFPLEVDEEHGTYEGLSLALQNHVNIEQLAKSLLMAKYNLDYNYFMS